jgi:hypothetical protein
MLTNSVRSVRPGSAPRVLAAIGEAALYVDDLLAAIPSVTRLALGLGARTDDVVSAFVADLDDYLATACVADELTSPAMTQFQVRSIARLTDAVRAEASTSALAVAI